MIAVLLWRLAGSAAVAQDDAAAQNEALVTFYSHHITLLGGTLGHPWGAFKGRLWDGDRQLAFMEPAHFVTFRVAPGAHQLTANSWMNKWAEPGAHVLITVEAGHHYYIETGSFAGYPVFGIREVNCQAAQKDGATLKPLEPAHLRAGGKAIALAEQSFPQCAVEPTP